MRIPEAVLRWIPRLSFDRNARAAEALVEGTADIPANAPYWRSITDGERDLPEVEYDRAIRNLHRLYERDGYATRICGYVEEYCVGPGVRLRSLLSEDAPAKPDAGGDAAAPAAEADAGKKVRRHEQLLRAVWSERQTRWPQFVREMARMFFLLSEQLYTAHVNGTTGMTAFGYVDPGNIKRVVMDPENARAYLGVLLKPRFGGVPTFLPHWSQLGQLDAKGAPVVPDEGETYTLPPDPGQPAGVGPEKAIVGRPCFYYAMDKAPSARRGLSRLYRVIDEMWGLDRIHFGAIEGTKVRDAFCWHLTVDTTDKKEKKAVEEEVKKAVGRKSGQVFSSTPGITLEPKAPTLGATERETAERNFRRAIFGKLGIPETWFADAENTGDSSTTELSAPTLKMLNGVQSVIVEALREMLDFALVQLAERDAQELLASDHDRALGEEHPVHRYDLGLPEIGGRDTNRDVQALVQLVTALDIAVGRRWITGRRAAELFQGQLRAIYGVELGPEDVPADVEMGPEKLHALRGQLEGIQDADLGGPEKAARAREAVLRALGGDYAGLLDRT